MSVGLWEFIITGGIVLPLLFLELFLTRRSIRRDREAKQQSEPARHPEGEHRLDP